MSKSKKADKKLEDIYECVEKDIEAEDPPSFKKPLFDFQRREVKRILDIESKRYFATNPNKAYNEVNAGDPMIVLSSACRMASPFGSGKSITVLAVIASRKPSPVYVTNSSIIDVTKHGQYRSHRYHGDVREFHGFQHEIHRKFRGVLNCSIIVVGTAVFKQWIDCIKDFTNLKVFAVKDFHSLKQFYELYKSERINNYDIILIKNGTVTSNFRVDGEIDLKEGSGSIRPILNVVNLIFNGRACQWLVYDDFDTIRIPAGTRSLNGLFTIYISTSNKTDSSHGLDNGSLKVYDTIEEMAADYSDPLITRVVYDTVLNTNFCVMSNKSFIENSVNLPIFKVFDCVYVNPDNKYIQLLGVMGTENANAIMEGLNADAIKTVAEAAGISADPTASSIFQKILDGEFEKYEMDCLILSVLDVFENTYKTLYAQFEVHRSDEHSETERERISKEIITLAKSWKKNKKSKDAEESSDAPVENAQRTITFEKMETIIKYSSRSIIEIITELRAKYTELKTRDGRAIDNVKENLRESECASCLDQLDDIIIAKCCVVTICGICLKSAFRFRKHIDYATNKEKVVGKCPHCLKNVDIEKDLVYVTRGVNIDQLIEATGVEEEEVTLFEVKKPAIVAEDLYKTTNPKLRALYDIIKRKAPENSKETSNVIDRLIIGTKDTPVPEDLPKKILLFAGYTETLDKIHQFLHMHNIQKYTLQGSSDEISNIIKSFRLCKEDSVLLVNSNQTCAGLNLQFSTDIVFFHKLIDRHIEAQVAGRAQRVGRVYNLNIWYLLYENEENHC